MHNAEQKCKYAGNSYSLMATFHLYSLANQETIKPDSIKTHRGHSHSSPPEPLKIIDSAVSGYMSVFRQHLSFVLNAVNVAQSLITSGRLFQTSASLKSASTEHCVCEELYSPLTATLVTLPLVLDLTKMKQFKSNGKCPCKILQLNMLVKMFKYCQCVPS